MTPRIAFTRDDFAEVVCFLERHLRRSDESACADCIGLANSAFIAMSARRAVSAAEPQTWERLAAASPSPAVAPLDRERLAEALLRVGSAMQLAATFEAMADMLIAEYDRLAAYAEASEQEGEDA